MKRAAALAVLMLAATLALAWFDPMRPPSHIAGARVLTQAQFVQSASAAPPPQGWQDITLPDSWRSRRPTASGLAWYRIVFTLDAVPATSQALYLPRLALAGRLWLNGALLSPYAPLAAPDQQAVQGRDVPVYVVLPATTFRAGRNTLTILLRGDAQVRSGLSAPQLGPVAAIASVWQRQQVLQVVLPYLQIILLGTTICLAYAYAQRRRQQLVLVLGLAVGLIAVALDLLPAFLPSPGERHALRIVVFASLLWLLSRGGLSLVNVRSAAVARLLDALWIVTLLVHGILIGLGWMGDRGWILLIPLSAALVVASTALLQQAWRVRSLWQLLLALSVIVWVGTVVQSFVLPWDWLPWDSFRYSSAGSLPCSVMLLLFLGEQFVLDREHAALRQRDAIAVERARILQDMHDGMGAQLITAKRLALRPEVERAELVQVIDDSLQDLRLIIDSLDVAQGDVLPLLGNLRFRLQPGLAAMGIALRWEVQPVPAFEALSPAGALAILRIVQESINNALRHADPSEISLAVMPAGDGVLIRVADNGCGFDQGLQRRDGRGLSGMRLRAQKMGAALSIESAPGQGTQVCLQVPLRSVEMPQPDTDR
ncbi:sensor histidine kinase [Xanthomonas euvesicatoria]|uniref:Signal transduction histidine kinase n=1 Tax=Xanthomonas euvesicatoria TaxID=456327 RepID=A0AAW3U6X1_XANEU|nr:ATP-binding protein [Xanthomonas euvesicatoria]MBB4724250.1 signal transduction histidine kinase [Xanthomonas euvesicatoria]MBB4870843.1 signal transduction histidine kinase [Xanthomonas euvesicatoria]